MRRAWLAGITAVALAAGFGACGGGDDGDGATDVGGDDATAEDGTTPDTAADADAEPDGAETTADVEPETTPDVEPETTPDVPADGPPDGWWDGRPDGWWDGRPDGDRDVRPETGLDGGDPCADPTKCETAADCVAYSDYTGDDCCSCDPYSVLCVPVEMPTCDCFVDPCMGRRADCVAGTCVIL